MTAPRSVLCVGQLVADVVVRPVDSLPVPGRTSLVEELELVAGGCAANTACVLGKLGADTRVGGLAGRDPMGDLVLGEIARCGVDVSGLRRWPLFFSWSALSISLRLSHLLAMTPIWCDPRREVLADFCSMRRSSPWSLSMSGVSEMQNG